MVGRILGYGRLFSLDQILEISTDLCHFPKKSGTDFQFLLSKLAIKTCQLTWVIENTIAKLCMQYVCMSFSKVTMVVYSFLSNFGNVTMVVYFFLGLFLKKELLVDLLWSLISPWSFIIFYWKKHGWSFISPWSFIYF